jgi:hypothetical protein
MPEQPAGEDLGVGDDDDPANAPEFLDDEPGDQAPAGPLLPLSIGEAPVDQAKQVKRGHGGRRTKSADQAGS